MKNILIALAATFLVSSLSYAGPGGTRVGDGGNGVECLGQPPQFLDLYEATQNYHYALDENPFAGPAVDSDQWAIFKEIEAIKARVATILRPGHPFLKNFDSAENLQQTMLLTSQPFAFVNGVVIVSGIAADCSVTTVADLKPLVGLYVSEVFWRALTTHTQALVLIHEALHQWFKGATVYGLSGTLSLRQMVAICAASDPIFYEKAETLQKLILTRRPVSAGEMATKY